MNVSCLNVEKISSSLVGKSDNNFQSSQYMQLVTLFPLSISAGATAQSYIFNFIEIIGSTLHDD